MTHPEHTNTPNQNPDTSNRAIALGRRLRERALPPLVAAFVRLRLAFGTRHGTRIGPKVRMAQLGAAAVAAAVLGVMIGNANPPAPQSPTASQQAPVEQAKVAPVAQAAPLEASAPKGKDQLDTWINQAHAVLAANGVPADKVNAQDTRTLIESESGGNPTIVNNWDSNAKKGTPSKGLMQTIDPTFQAFAVPGHKDILNPVDNIVAASRYSIQDYGSVSNTPGIASKKSGNSYQGY